jgi:3-oxoacyl-[acyl-carrier protein] reductase
MLTRLFEEALVSRKALVFGASSGIGFACAELLSAMGAEVTMIARNAEKLDLAAERIRASSGNTVTTEPVDITDVERMRTMLSRHTDTDILITNCGGPPVGPFETLTLNDWEQAWQGQLRSAVQASRELVPAMAGRGWGRVVMLASITVVHPMKGFALSNAVRPGLAGLAATLTQEYAPQGVTANAVCPGITATARMEKLLDKAVEKGVSRENVAREWTQKVPVGRMGKAEEIASLVGYLVTDAAAYITGQTLVADGGESVSG